MLDSQAGMRLPRFSGQVSTAVESVCLLLPLSSTVDLQVEFDLQVTSMPSSLYRPLAELLPDNYRPGQDRLPTRAGRRRQNQY